MLDHKVRIAGKLDLPAINAVVAAAVASWDTTERVKRLALPVYRYRQEDLDHMWLLASEGLDGALLGCAALEEADSADIPARGRSLLLHGVYVTPEYSGVGVGRQLLAASAGIARSLGYEGLLIKSVRQSRGFFDRCGLQSLPAERATDYPYRYWLPTGPTPHPTLEPDLVLQPDILPAQAR